MFIGLIIKYQLCVSFIWLPYRENNINFVKKKKKEKSSTDSISNSHSSIVFLFSPVLYIRRYMFKNILSRTSMSFKYPASLLRCSNHVRIRYSRKVLAASSTDTSVIGLFHRDVFSPFFFPNTCCCYYQHEEVNRETMATSFPLHVLQGEKYNMGLQGNNILALVSSSHSQIVVTVVRC